MFRLIIFGIAIIYIDGIEAGCPIRCNCTKNSVTCISKQLEYVPYFESLSNNPIIIDLSGNNIGNIDIDDFSFDKTEFIKEIYLNNSNVNSIDEMAFEELDNLQELYLAENLLTSLPENFIEYNENMILLDLSRNHFERMPKIKSKSLEVLALANSGIEYVDNEVLEGLPNLRVLLLQQNNLKYMNPIIFDNMHHFFFVRLAYNPWKCDCKTMKLFNYLLAKSFTDITEAVQCQTENKDFIDIYQNNQIVDNFQDKCINNFINEQLFQEEFNEYNMTEGKEKFDENQDEFVVINTVKNEQNNDWLNSDYYDINGILMLTVLISFSFLFGILLGSYVTYQATILRQKRKTESTKRLLDAYVERVV